MRGIGTQGHQQAMPRGTNLATCSHLFNVLPTLLQHWEAWACSPVSLRLAAMKSRAPATFQGLSLSTVPGSPLISSFSPVQPVSRFLTHLRPLPADPSFHAVSSRFKPGSFVFTIALQIRPVAPGRFSIPRPAPGPAREQLSMRLPGYPLQDGLYCEQSAAISPTTDLVFRKQIMQC